MVEIAANDLAEVIRDLLRIAKVAMPDDLSRADSDHEADTPASQFVLAHIGDTLVGTARMTAVPDIATLHLLKPPHTAMCEPASWRCSHLVAAPATPATPCARVWLSVLHGVCLRALDLGVPRIITTFDGARHSTFARFG